MQAGTQMAWGRGVEGGDIGLGGVGRVQPRQCFGDTSTSDPTHR